MAGFDLAVGISGQALTTAMARVHAKPEARTKLFSGREELKSGTPTGTAEWDIQKAPEFKLGPPSADHWSKSVDPNGKRPSAPPPADMFELLLPQAMGKWTPTDGTPKKGTGPISAYCRGVVNGKKVTIDVLAVRFDESVVKPFDQVILKKIIIPRMFTMGRQLLGGIAIPGELFGTKVDLTPQKVQADSSHLVLTAVLPGTPNGSATWPAQKPFFTLFSHRLLEAVLQQAATKQRDKDLGSVKKDFMGFTGEVTAKIKAIREFKVDAKDMTRSSCQPAIDFSAVLRAPGVGPDGKGCPIISGGSWS
ncbi:hypothetical protein [Streptomyces sp. NPDC001678]|uniref:hypothetical protein n=1 Tax=Streptomyces sp. NPDC001678 TaxID=3364599 RepID=UPI0036A9B3D8